MSAAAKSIKRNKQLPAHSVMIEISATSRGIPCDITAFLFKVEIRNQSAAGNYRP